MKLHIKNMVCNRCKMVVRNELEKLGYKTVSVELGEVILEKDLSPEDKEKLDLNLRLLGFSIIDDRKSRIIEKIKNLIIELVHQNQNQIKVNLSHYLTSNLNLDYSYLSSIFSGVEGTTIEQYYIAQKIEKVKEMLVYDEYTLSEIAFCLNYSSAAHLSNQFKKITGLTPGYFKNLKKTNVNPWMKYKILQNFPIIL